jgi:DNA-binding transcriptional LysR family regulator
MPRHSLSPDKLDWLCRNVLSELAVYRHAVESGSPKAAHEGLMKTPAAIGQSIHRLERHLGEWLDGGALTNQLHKKTIQPNEAGRMVFEFADNALNNSQTFLESLQSFQRNTEIRLACIHSAWMTYGAVWLDDLRARVADASINPQLIGGENYPQKIALAVLEGNADLGITSYPPKVEKPLVFQPFKSRSLVLVFSPQYKSLPSAKGPVDLARIISKDNGLKVAVHHRAMNSPLSNLVVYYLNQIEAYLGPNQLLEVQNIEEIKTTISRFPATISILPEDAVVYEVKEGRLKTFPLEPSPREWKWGLIYRAGTSRESVLQLIECFRPLFKGDSHKKLRKI